MKGLFFPILSLKYPENALKNAAVLSAIPSISDIEVLEAPIDSKKSGITLYTILVDVSVKKLVIPMKNTFLFSPNIFLSSIIFLLLLILLKYGVMIQLADHRNENPCLADSISGGNIFIKTQ